MPEYFSGIRQIGPTYPIKPPHPTQKDREPGKRRRDKEQPEPPSRGEEQDSDDKPTIDEHV